MQRVGIYRHRLFGASEPFIHQQANALKRYEPMFMCFALQGEPPAGVEVRLAEPGKRRLGRGIALAKYALTRRPADFGTVLGGVELALLHAHFGIEGVYAVNLARVLNVPLVTTFHGYDATTTTQAFLQSGKPTFINYVLFKKELAKHGDLFIAVSDHIRTLILQKGFPEDRTVTHYIGVDTLKFTPPERRANDPVVLTVARLAEKKGTVYLIQAFEKVVAKYADAKLIIAGDGPLKPELEGLSKRLSLQDKISFLGAQPHDRIRELMKQASVFCLPSVTAKSGDSEGLPIVLLEAAASGLPSVATIHSGIPEAVNHGLTGFLVPERSVDALADRIVQLLASDSVRTDMGLAARGLVERRFDLAKQTEKLEELYDRVGRRHSSPPSV